MTSLKICSFVRPRGTLPASLALVFALMAAACAPVATRPTTAAEETVQQAREARLAQKPDWSFRGRVALSQGNQGGNAGIRWRQRGAEYDIELTAPITGQRWHLQSQDGRVSLEGLEGGRREGSDAEALLLEATGWRIPVASMSAWARGARAPGPSELRVDPGSLPATLVQDGWTIEYRAWLPGEPPLPQKLFARRGDASVRLVVESWEDR
jgi:outer membrane lipoprotein LolB